MASRAAKLALEAARAIGPDDPRFVRVPQGLVAVDGKARQCWRSGKLHPCPDRLELVRAAILAGVNLRSEPDQSQVPWLTKREYMDLVYRRLVSEGLDAHQIAERVGKKVSAVYVALRERGLKARRKGHARRAA